MISHTIGLLAAAALGTAAPAALAHPGDHAGGLLAALAHLLTEPDHLALAALSAGAGWAAVRLIRRSRPGKSLDRKSRSS